MFSHHMQQGSNVWYCPDYSYALQIKDERAGYPTYKARHCPGCGQHVKPEAIR